MKRLLALVACSLLAGAATISCGGGDTDTAAAPAAAAPADKLTIVGSGS